MACYRSISFANAKGIFADDGATTPASGAIGAPVVCCGGCRNRKHRRADADRRRPCFGPRRRSGVRASGPSDHLSSSTEILHESLFSSRPPVMGHLNPLLSNRPNPGLRWSRKWWACRRLICTTGSKAIGATFSRLPCRRRISTSGNAPRNGLPS